MLPGEERRRLVADVLAVGAPYGLVLAGGQAVQALGLVDRPGRELEVATESPAETGEIVAAVRAGLEARGWGVRVAEAEPLGALLAVTEPVTGEECAVQVVKEVLWRPAADTELGPALSEEDAVGTRVRALADQGLAADLVDVHAVSDRWSRADLEELGRRHAGGVLDLADLRARLDGAEWIDDRELTACGLDPAAVPGLRRWAQEWADDIGERLAESEAPDDGG
ncbi:hypothetical protein [Streptomyces tropicalis]|uniref:Nucleotidyl transferase AbiEii/AbiGii toxin family protein n=1 Tax=Streptomyces tropicalis TaxID=3034234 RepID=A0ABT6A7B0_9ACTN|nr:hypothetical protein [Streptomyces tropicalis]MDF3300538.1 hypothetical protein [Streptomyces tropicalis]